MSNNSLKIAICGTRGIPACYGGFETFAEELSTRLVARGHSVVVYGRRHVIDWQESMYRGVEVRLLPAPAHKYLETPVHSLLSFLHLLRHPVDVVLLCNGANSPFAWIPRLRGIPVWINVDGIERQRAKWNALGRLWYRLGEWCSVHFCTGVIADADCIRDYYFNKYGCHAQVIRYGYRAVRQELVRDKVSGNELNWSDSEKEIFQRFGLQPNNYLLYVSRLEPENNAHLVIEAYQKLSAEERRYPLVIVGDAPYASEYIARLKSRAGSDVKFLGYQFGQVYETLQLGAWCYVQATEVGGTHPALVEGMGFGNCILATDVPEHREVLGDTGLYFGRGSPSDLQRQLQALLNAPDRVILLRKAAFQRIQDISSWDKIANEYESLLRTQNGKNRT